LSTICDLEGLWSAFAGFAIAFATTPSSCIKAARASDNSTNPLKGLRNLTVPTLRINEITCKGFNGTLKFQPKLGTRKAGNPIKVESPRNTTLVVINFDPGDRLFFLKLDTKETYEGGLLPTDQGADGEYVFDTAPRQTLKCRYSID
jgi:hypothetical protein